MSVKFYMDVHVPGPITGALRARSVDVLTAQEDRQDRTPDDVLLSRASELGRVLVSNDEDFFAIVAIRQLTQIWFAGVVSLPSSLSYREAIDELEMIAKCSEPREWEGLIMRLPL